jgi:hypothetical protein
MASLFDHFVRGNEQARPFVKGQSGNPLGRARASDQLFTDAVRKAALVEDKLKKIRKLDMIAEKLVAKAIEGDNWCIGQVGDRLDGKPKEHTEHDGVVDHAIRIVWAGMPPINGASSPQIEAAEPVPALPPPQAEVGNHCSAPSSGEDGGDDQ